MKTYLLFLAGFLFVAQATNAQTFDEIRDKVLEESEAPIQKGRKDRKSLSKEDERKIVLFSQVMEVNAFQMALVGGHVTAINEYCKAPSWKANFEAGQKSGKVKPVFMGRYNKTKASLVKCKVDCKGIKKETISPLESCVDFCQTAEIDLKTILSPDKICEKLGGCIDFNKEKCANVVKKPIDICFEKYSTILPPKAKCEKFESEALSRTVGTCIGVELETMGFKANGKNCD